MENSVAANGNMSSVGIRLFSAYKAYHFVIVDPLAAVVRNVLVANDLEGVGDFDTLTCVGGVVTNILAEST